MNVLFIASEVSPLSKSGGLGDVAGALPRALEDAGAKVTVVCPRYAQVDVDRYALARRLRKITVPLGDKRVEVGLYEGRLPASSVAIYLVDHPPSYDRPGLYGDGHKDFPDNAQRFALLSRAALEIGRSVVRWPDVVHAHDWQTGLVPFLIKRRALPDLPMPGTVLTIHNLAFLGLFPKMTVEELGLPWDAFTPDGYEFYDQLSLLKAGLTSADRVTTVSPRYAREIRQPEFGCGLDGLLRALGPRLVGILNGVDYDVWDPSRDPHIPQNYSASDLSGKAVCKRELQRRMGLPERPDVPLFGSISRFTEQKGFDLAAAIADDLARLDLQYVLLGNGDEAIEGKLRALAQRYPTRFAVRIAYDNALAHQIEAGADVVVMPSRFEPCGLNQMYSLRYGTPPLVRATGGLDDTVVDWDPGTRTGTGFKFTEYTAEALLETLTRVLDCYRDQDGWTAMVRSAMAQDYSWRASARQYVQLYEQIALTQQR
jgi:starch synthase